MTKKVLIIGAAGQLGGDICNTFHQLDTTVLCPTHDELDITQLKLLKDYLFAHKPDVVINTAAYHHVDLCERNPQTAHLVNATAPAFIARMCSYFKIKFVHFSTDYVFDGVKNTPYHEQDKPNPLNVYGKSKWLGEQNIIAENHAALILRVSALYGHHPCRAKNGLNFVELMLKLAEEKPTLTVVDDEFISPTATMDIANFLPKLLNNDLSGIVHLTSEGYCSWYEFAETILKLAHIPTPVEPVNSTFFENKTPRPKYTVLENNSLKNRGMSSMPHWKDALANYLHHKN